MAAEAIEHLEAGRNPLLVAPTGAGKTVILAPIVRRYKRVGFFAHRREILKQTRALLGRHVLCYSIQGALARAPKRLDLLVFDEAHRTGAKTYQQIIKRYPDAPRVGLTATPLRTDGRGLNDSFSAIVQGCEMKQLVQDGFLVPYRAFEAPDEALDKLDSLQKKMGDFHQGQLAKLMSAPRLVGNVVREYQRLGAGRKAVVFAVNIEHSKILESAFKGAGVRAAHIDGRASEDNRDAALRALANGSIDVLCNVNLFTEGWDCPPVSCVIMARPTMSLTLCLQSVGRGMRPSPGKQDVVLLDHAGNFARHGYPDDVREWSLEGAQDRTEREALERRLAYICELGFDSLEAYELEQKRLRETTCSCFEVQRMLAQKGIRSNPSAFLRRRGVKPISGSKGSSARYRVDEIARVMDSPCDGYTKEEVQKLGDSLAVPLGTKFLRSRGIDIGWVGKPLPIYPKEQIDSLLRDLSSSYSLKECSGLLRQAVRRVTFYLRQAHGIRPIAESRAPFLRYKKSQIDDLARLLRATVHTAEARSILGVASPTFAKLLKQHKIAPAMGAFASLRYFRSDIDEIARSKPRCMVCGKPISFSRVGASSTCGTECGRVYRDNRHKRERSKLAAGSDFDQQSDRKGINAQ